MKKILINIVMMAVVVTMIHAGTLTAYAKTTCAHEGCDRGVDSGSFCRIHKCGKSGCNREKETTGLFIVVVMLLNMWPKKVIRLARLVDV